MQIMTFRFTIRADAKQALILLIGFCMIIYFLNLGRWDLWNPDEPRYGQVAKEIVQTGDWIVMHRNAEVYTEKPPLFFWFVALVSMALGGFSSFTVRFPAAVFGTLTVLLTFLIGKRLFGPRSGLLSGFVLATTGLYAYLSTRGNIDTTLTFFTTAAFYFFACWYHGQQEEHQPMNGMAFWGFYASLGLATLAKGPVGFVIPLLVILLFLLISHEGKALGRMRLGPGCLLFVALVLAWYVPAYQRGGDLFLQKTLFRQTIGRFVEGVSKSRPLYYYFINLPLDFLPWTFFLPGALFLGLKKDNRKSFLFLAVWFAATFVFFTLCKGKRELYLLPLYPAAALMVGRLFDLWIDTGSRKLWMTVPIGCLGAFFLLAGIVALPIARSRFPEFTPAILPVSGIFVLGAFALGLLVVMKQRVGVFIAIVLTMALSWTYVQAVVFPRINPYKSARFISEELRTKAGAEGKAAIFGDIEPGPFNFYSGIVPITSIETDDEVRRFLHTSERVHILARRDKLSEMRERSGGREFREIAKSRIGGHEIVLLSNR